MTEQIKLPIAPEEKVFSMVQAPLESVLMKHKLSLDSLSLERRKEYYSVLFHNTTVLFRIAVQKAVIISVPKNVLLASPLYGHLATNKKSKFEQLFLSSLEDIQEYIPLLQTVLQETIERVPKEWDCCHLYTECSNAKSCVFPDKKIALKCGYRKILNTGKIFYGKNRNV